MLLPSCSSSSANPPRGGSIPLGQQGPRGAVRDSRGGGANPRGEALHWLPRLLHLPRHDPPGSSPRGGLHDRVSGFVCVDLCVCSCVCYSIFFYYCFFVYCHLFPITDETGPGAGEGGPTETVEPVQLQLMDHSTYARNKLAHLQERLTNKLLVSVLLPPHTTINNTINSRT